MGADVTMKIDEILRGDSMVWLGGVELSLMEFSETDLLPSKILLCGGGSALPGIRKVLSSDEWIQNLSFSKPPVISFLQPGDVIRVFDSTKELKTPQDVTPMGLANLALEIAGEEKVMAGILRRVLQGMQR